jgi:hypothetical protein
LDSLPHTYTDTKKWNLQAEKQTGLGFRRDPGGLIETYRKRELVNHGEWSKFSATLLDPQDQFQIQIVNPRPLADGRMAFDVHIAASLAIEGRQAKWNRGVQLYSIGAEGSAKVRLIVNCSLATSLDISHLPPDLILDPRIEGAQLRVDEFRLNRVGKLGGEFSQQVAAATRKVLDQKIAEKEKQLVAKLNDKIDQNRHKFRLSPRSAAELKWTPAAKPHLPPPVQNVLNNHPDK